MPHNPRKFVDREHAEMMVYALEEHFLRISKVLDFCNVPAKNEDDLSLNVDQRVILLRNALLDTLPVENPNYDWDRLKPFPADNSWEDAEDPEEVAEKIAALYEEKSSV